MHALASRSNYPTADHMNLEPCAPFSPCQPCSAALPTPATATRFCRSPVGGRYYPTRLVRAAPPLAPTLLDDASASRRSRKGRGKEDSILPPHARREATARRCRAYSVAPCTAKPGISPSSSLRRASMERAGVGSEGCGMALGSRGVHLKPQTAPRENGVR